LLNDLIGDFLLIVILLALKTAKYVNIDDRKAPA